MRPLDKWNVGHIIDANTKVLKQYDPYRKAKHILSANFGNNCSYCEKAYIEERDLHVEHIKYKAKYPNLETLWGNFLLSCATCNGADNKGTKDVKVNHCHLPHRNNTFLSFVYKAGGVVEVNPNLNANSHTNAEKLYNLIGLGKTPKTSSNGDTRWKARQENWDLAQRILYKYINKKIDIETILELVKARGGWSIWFTIFKGHDDVRKALIDEFPGTAANCFDPNNHYEPLPRNPQNITDPV